MAALQTMPPVSLPPSVLQPFGEKWLLGEKGKPERFSKRDSLKFGAAIDSAVGKALAVMLGDLPIEKPSPRSLQPVLPDCVEVGPVRVVGGVRPQNFDVGYRPDGIRIAYDSKTLNEAASIGKNWQNMVNDLATEATTVHSRFNSAIVAFLFVVPEPCMQPGPRTNAMIGTLTRLGGRKLVDEPEHRAEAISLVAWDPHTGQISPTVPASDSALRLERFHEDLYAAYHARFQGLPPHAV